MILQSSLTMLLYFFFIFRRSKQMQTATNAILTGLAVSDLLVMASYVPYAYHTFVRPAIDEHIRFSYGWTLYTLLHANSSVVLHTVSIWLTVLLAVFRYNALRCYRRYNVWLNVRRARLAVFIVYVACPLFCLPALFTFTIKPREAATHLISSPGLPSIGPGFDSSSVELIDWLTRLPPPPSPPPPSSTWSETSKMNGRPLSTDQDQETSWWTDLGPDPPLIHIYPLSTPPLSIPFPAFSLPVTVSLNLSDLSSVDIDRLRSFLVPIPSLTYRVTFSDVAIAHNQLLNRLNFWLYSVLTKLVPCVALTFLSVALIRLLCHANFRRNRLLRLRTHRPVVVRACSLASHTSSLRPTSTVAPVSSASLPSHLAPPVPTSVCSSTSIGLANVHPNHQHHQHDAATCPHHSSQRLSIRSSSDSILPSLGPSKHVLTFNLSPAVSLNNTRTTSLRPTVSVTSRPCPLQSNPTVSFEQATNRTIKLRTNQRASMDGNLFAVATSHTSGQSTSGTSNTTANVNCDRSTRMLICILVLFLLTEFPSGLLALLSAILGELFFHNVYHNLGEVMDLMALINSGINFLLYCSMSSKFRRAFHDTFLNVSIFRPRQRQRQRTGPTKEKIQSPPFQLAEAKHHHAALQSDNDLAGFALKTLSSLPPTNYDVEHSIHPSICIHPNPALIDRPA